MNRRTGNKFINDIDIKPNGWKQCHAPVITSTSTNRQLPSGTCSLLLVEHWLLSVKHRIALTEGPNTAMYLSVFCGRPCQ